MKFGLFYEHQLPKPWKEGDEHQLLKDALDQIELADQLGYDYVWEVEHHFLEEYSHSSAPEVFLAAASQRTKNIRIGHGIVQLPMEFNHPARVAERIATLDLISDGRVEFGTGEGSAEIELGGFNVDRAVKRREWSEALDAITKMFVETPFAGYNGEFLKMPARNVLPKPMQKPHPPLWMACSQHETITLAASKGIGALSFAFIEPEQAKEWVDEYYKIIASEQCNPAGFSVNPNVAIVLPFSVHEDEKTAVERGVEGANFFDYSLGHYYAFGKHRPGYSDIWDEFNKNQLQATSSASEETGHETISRRGAIGTPEQVRDILRRYEEAGVDQVIFISQAGKNQHEHICEALNLFAKEVMPEFKDRDEQYQARKQQKLALAMEQAMERKKPARHSDEDYTVVSPPRLPITESVHAKN
ncbi:LLM class flavin-dependent oxidoreductase [Neobacillus sp. FSL H8-0543]|uniref:LLM class flavin-dependent oxidoreductase n=1 Tax=Neobacillus sp. FSL H8-0543 TaxID=2954672 RepID=UPI0031587806